MMCLVAEEDSEATVFRRKYPLSDRRVISLGCSHNPRPHLGGGGGHPQVVVLDCTPPFEIAS